MCPWLSSQHRKTLEYWCVVIWNVVEPHPSLSFRKQLGAKGKKQRDADLLKLLATFPTYLFRSLEKDIIINGLPPHCLRLKLDNKPLKHKIYIIILAMLRTNLYGKKCVVEKYDWPMSKSVTSQTWFKDRHDSPQSGLTLIFNLNLDRLHRTEWWRRARVGGGDWERRCRCEF